MSLREILEVVLLGGTRCLRNYEEACINSWKNQLSDDAVVILQRQMERFTLFQRSPNGSLVTFFDSKDRECKSWHANDFFPIQLNEACVARVWINAGIDHEAADVKADIIVYRGRMSSIYFSRPPASLRRGYIVKQVMLFLDPMEPYAPTTAFAQLADVAGVIGRYLRAMGATIVYEPRPPCEREAILRTIDARLPDDFLTLVSATEGAVVGEWRIYGLSQVRRIVQPEGSYYVIAEATDGVAIGVIREGSDGSCYIISPEGAEPRRISHSLLAFLEAHISAGTTAL